MRDNTLLPDFRTPDPAEYQEGDLEKFFGIDPDFTGGMSTEDYVDYVRSGRRPKQPGVKTMKIVYGYQQNGTFLLATVQDDSLSENIDEIKQTVDAVQLEGESFVEIGRADCQKVAKLMQFGKKGDIRVADFNP